MRVSYVDAVTRGWITPQEAASMQAGTLPAAVTRANKERSPAKKVRKTDVEGQEQAELISWFRTTFPLYAELLIHIPNGGYRKNAFEGWRLKQQGVRAGVSDLFLPVAAAGKHGLWIEFKATPPFDAAISDSQQQWLALMRAQDYEAHVCKGTVEASQVIKNYLPVRQ